MGFPKPSGHAMRSPSMNAQSVSDSPLSVATIELDRCPLACRAMSALDRSGPCRPAGLV